MKLIIISTCTNAKKRPLPDSSCLLDNCIKKTCDETVDEWLRNIQSPKHYNVCAEQLYMGSHWKETLGCVDAAKKEGFNPELWILSAGWGLIRSDSKISPYSATFSQGANSIHNLPWPEEFSAQRKAQMWWKGINTKRGLSTSSSISSLFNSSDPIRFLIILSREYYSAVETEILELISRGAEVIIVSAGLYSDSRSTSPVARDHMLPVTDKFKQADEYLNHTNVSLNARLAKWIIQKFPKEIESGLLATHEAISKIAKSLPEIIRRDVVRMTDEDVRCFIKGNYSAELRTASALLKMLRHREKKSCEQKRFGKLFNQYKSEKDKGLFDV